MTAPLPPQGLKRSYDFIAGTNNAFHHGGQIVPGKVFGALTLDGVDDYAVVNDTQGTPWNPNPDALDVGYGDFSVDFWFKTSTIGGPTIVAKGDAYRVSLLGAGAGIGLLFNYLPYVSTLPQGTLNDGAWHFVAITVDRDRTDGIKFFIDGVQQASSPDHDPTSAINSDVSNSADVLIGTTPPGVYPSYFSGSIDELEIFNRVLTSAEISAIFNAGPFGKCVCRNC